MLFRSWLKMFLLQCLERMGYGGCLQRGCWKETKAVKQAVEVEMRPWMVLLPILHGCALNCEEKGCSGTLSLFLQGQPAEGIWSVEVTLDNQNSVCRLSYPDGEAACSGSLSLAAGPEGMTATWMTMMGEESALGHLRVSHDGLLLIDEDFQPE